MAKGEQRGNREAKKPKKEKPKAVVATSPFANQGKGMPQRNRPAASDSVFIHNRMNLGRPVCRDRIMRVEMRDASTGPR